jgi:type I restriction enzyme, S subunit
MSHPSNWIEVRFEEIVQNITDRIDKPSESGLDYYVGLEHLNTDCIRIKKYGSPEQVNATKYISKKGDIIFGKRRAYLRKVAITQHPAVVSAHSMILRPKGKLIHPDFLPCFLQSSTFWKVALSISEGSLSPTIKWKTLAKQEFVIPPLEEQKRIAGLLWSIEDNIEKTENLIAINDKLITGLLNELISGINDSKLSKYIIFEKKSSRRAGEGLSDGEYPFFTSSPIQSKRIDEADYGGEYLIFGTGGSASLHYYNGKFSTSADCFVIKSLKMRLKYIYYHLLRNFEVLEKGFVGGALKHLSKRYLQNIDIGTPSLTEQERIISVLDQETNTNEDLKNHLIKTFNLKKKLTDEIMKGEVRL